MSECVMEKFIVDECLGEIVWGRFDLKNKVLRVRRAKARDARASAFDGVIVDVLWWYVIMEMMLVSLNE